MGTHLHRCVPIFFHQTDQNMYPFPSINQFRHVITQVRHQAAYMGLDEAGEAIYNPAPKYPTLTFQGTVKLHGTNAAIVFENGVTTFQSRERVLTFEADNAGFYAHMNQPKMSWHLKCLQEAIAMELGCSGEVDDQLIAVYGEWCGGNIQKNVAIAGSPKMFVIFAVKVNDVWQDISDMPLMREEASIYNIEDFPSWTINIDFEKPEIAQNMLAALTEKVEEMCPVGKAFGNEGIGEGIVWRCASDLTSELWFKVKGEKHSASKVKTLASTDVESVARIRDFVEQVVTPQRLEQGLANITNEKMLPFAMTSMGDFIRWVHADVIKEESDTILASQFDVKKLGGPIALVAKRWFVEQLNAAAMQ